MVSTLRRSLISAALAVCLCLSLLLSACSGSSGGLSGNYVDDTVHVAQVLQSTIALPPDDPARKETETEARALITSYMARYRPRRDVNGLASFTTMQTALNSLAGHYANYANRPLPDPLRSRLEKELSKAEASVVRGT
ncbi:MAG: photosystem II protein Psb27 [Synechococcaceae cyanobacterium]|nr:photosystem II protein Psb27 [Synechococcaceae cyanobacterium]